MTVDDGPLRSTVPVTSGSLVGMAWLLASTQAAVDLSSRMATIRAVPALAALELAITASVVVLGAIGLRLRERRRRPADGGTSTWRLWIALAGLSIVVVGRVAISPLEPTVSMLAPFLLVAPFLLTLELVAMRRGGDRLTATTWIGFSTTWTAVAAVAAIALLFEPSSWYALSGSTATATIGWSLVVVGVSWFAVCHRVGRRRERLRPSSVVGAGLVLVLAPTMEPSSLWPTVVAAIAALGAILVPRALVGQIASATMRRVQRAYALSAAAARRASEGSGRALLLIRRLWGRIVGAAAPRDVRRRPPFRAPDAIGVGVMASASMAWVLHGLWWAHRVGWQPTAHAATQMARAAQVGTIDHPLIGMGTSLGNAAGDTSHPGPMGMDLLAPWIKVFGVQNGALLAGAAVTLVCGSVAVWAAWRASGRLAAIVAWMTCAMVVAVPELGTFWESNNISIPMLALAAAVMASWAAATGAWRAWWWAVGLGCLGTQSYLPYALVLLGPIVWAGLGLAGARRLAADPEDRRRATVALRGGWVILAIAWFQPLLDAVLHQGGNLAALAGEVAHPRPEVGVTGFPRAIAWTLSLPPKWGSITGSFAAAGTSTSLLRGSLASGAVVGVVLAVAWWRTRRSVPDNERQLRAITLAVLVGAGVNLTQLPQDFLRSFQLGWLVIASLLVWFAVVVSVGLALQRRSGRVPGWRWTPAARWAALAVGVVAVAVAGLTGPSTIEDVKGRPFTIDAMVNPLVDQTMRSMDLDGPVLVHRTGSRLNETVTDTILANLLVRGLDARVEPGLEGWNYGARRIVDRWRGPMLWIISGPDSVKPGGRLLARASVPGWSQRRFDETAERAARLTRDAPRVELEPWAVEYLPRYLSAWYGGSEACALSEQIRTGSFPLASLPPRLLLTLYGDLAIRSPRLPSSMQDDAAGLVGQAPLEVWLTTRSDPAAIRVDDMLRDGSSCPPTRVRD